MTKLVRLLPVDVTMSLSAVFPIRAHPRHVARLAGRRVLLIDDVMTSGATFSAAAQACLRAGADGVDVIALARVARDG